MTLEQILLGMEIYSRNELDFILTAMEEKTLLEFVDKLQQENQKYKEVINKIKSTCDKVPNDWTLCGIEVVNKIENILKEVEDD